MAPPATGSRPDTEAQELNSQGIPVPDRSWKLGDWLDYWLEHVVAPNRRPATYALYEMIARLYLKPALGTAPLARLSAARVQAFLNGQLAAGQSIRQVQVMRTVLSSALTRAMREELLMRNVARLVELPGWERQPIAPWTAEEARGFLTAARDDPLYPAFVLLLLYGLRRGEVLGLRWTDVDLGGGEIRVRQQIGRVNGELRVGPVKTNAGRRDLPMLPLAVDMFGIRHEARPLTVRSWAGPGRTTGSSSPPGQGGRSNRATSSVRSTASALQRHTGDQASSPPAHDCDPAQEPRRPGPRCPADPRPLPAGCDPGDLYPQDHRRSMTRSRRSARHCGMTG